MGRPQGSSTPDFDSLVAYLASGKYPDYMKNDRGKKVNFRRQAACYTLRSGVLFRKHRPHRHGGVVLELRVVTERKEREWILRACHEGTNGTCKEAGLQGVHVGQGKTCGRILERFWWPGVTKDIVGFIRTCAQCHKAGLAGVEEPAVPREPVPDLPWNCVVVDVVSLPRTADGLVGVALAVDCHSKWVEAEPLRAMSAECVARFLCGLVCRYGCAYDVLIRNQGQDFAGAVTEMISELVGLKQKVTGIYDFSQIHQLDIKACGYIQDCLVRTLKTKHEDWPRALPRILLSHRVGKPEKSDHSPFFQMFGRQPHLTAAVALHCSSSSGQTGVSSCHGCSAQYPQSQEDVQGSVDSGGTGFVESAVDNVGEYCGDAVASNEDVAYKGEC